MKPEIINVSGKECYLFAQSASLYLLIQPVDEHDLELLDQEVEIIEALTAKRFSLVTFRIEDWNQELSPWEAPPVFGKVPFGNGAEKTLAFVTSQLLPDMQERGIDTSHCLLGGYSLAGLFALWTSYQSDRFVGIAAASPSVWFPGWIEYAKENRPRAYSIYLSLGDKEEKARNPLMAQVGNAIRKQEEILKEQGMNTILEWNAGNHFIDSEKRMAKGFAWLMNNMKK
jgi:predicted alpha/beta superfamily hydrolase